MGGRIRAAVGAWAVGAGTAAAVAPVPDPGPPPADAAGLVARLGADRFADREAAARALEQMGPAAVPALRASAASADGEVRRRASALADRLDRAAESARLLAVKPVRLDYANVPLGNAVHDLRARTGIPLALDPNRVENPLRPVSVKTADLPPWEAVDAFCRAAGLREAFAADLAPPKPDVVSHRRRQTYTATPAAPTSAGAVPVLLADGTPETLPGDRSTAVRVLVLPAAFPGNRVVLGSGEVTLNLDVTPAPGPAWQGVVGVTVRRALDAAGRPVPASHRIEAPGAVGQQFDNGMMVINGRVAMWQSSETPAAGPGATPNPRVVPLALRVRDGGRRSLRLLEGAVHAEVVVPNQTLLTVADVRKPGVATDGANGTRLTVTDTRVDAAAGTVTVRARSEGPSPFALQMQRARGNAANAFGVVGIAVVEPTRTVSETRYVLTDAAGHLVPATSTGVNDVSVDEFRTLADLELTFRTRTPVGLVVVGPRTVPVDVPFRLENVPLP